LTVFYYTQFAPPPPKNSSGAVTSLSFYRPRFNAYIHLETENSSIMQIEQSSSYYSSGENQPIAKNEIVVLIQIVWEERFLLDAKCGLHVSVLVNRLLICMIIKKVQTQTRPVLLGCEMTPFCYMTRSIIHYAHDRNFESPWLLYVNREQLHLWRYILTTSY